MRNYLMALVGTLALAGCTTAPETRVTRFHLGQPIARGEIRVEAGDPGQMGSLELAALAAPIERELTRLGWTPQKIGKELGMDADEVLRLKQISGLTEMFAGRQFSQAWTIK